MIHLDTSVLIDALSGPRRSELALRMAIAEGEPIAISAIAYYEWRRGLRGTGDLDAQARLFPISQTIAFGAAEAAKAAELRRRLKGRGRDLEVAIAACAILHGAALWTLTPRDFAGIPGLRLYRRT